MKSMLQQPFGRILLVTLLVLLPSAALYLTRAATPVDLHIDGDYPNARLQSVEYIDDKTVRIRAARDPDAPEGLWFRFRVTSTTPVKPTFKLENFDELSQGNWHVVAPMFSVDGERWQAAESSGVENGLLDRLQRKVNGGKAEFAFTAPFAARAFEVAYSTPYDLDTLNAWLATLPDDLAAIDAIGTLRSGRTIPLITFGAGAATAKQHVWIIGREHPGETPSSFFLQGLVDETLANLNAFPSTRFHVVPILNVDGVAEGLYYRNPQSVDLAKDWQAQQSEELRLLSRAMRPTLESSKVALVINAHAANAPLNHFMIKPLRHLQSEAVYQTQQRLMKLLDDMHPQFSLENGIDMWDLPGICGNYLPAKHGVYCLYIESNYNIGADGSRVTPDTLDAFGASMSRALARFLNEGAATNQEMEAN
ncbi:MAG: M14-type cytosolic carboxypeptidase [Pseudomonadota bacterium]